MHAHGAYLCRATLVAALLGCAARPVAESSPAPEPPASDLGASLEVENNGTLDVRVFLLRGSVSTRIGLVTGMTTGRFELKANQIDRDIRLHATEVGGWTRGVKTDVFRVRPGQRVSWKLDNKLRSERLSVY
jgi:hypothetical protein